MNRPFLLTDHVGHSLPFGAAPANDATAGDEECVGDMLGDFRIVEFFRNNGNLCVAVCVGIALGCLLTAGLAWCLAPYVR